MSYRPPPVNKLNMEATVCKTVHTATKVTAVPTQIEFESGVTLTGVSVVSGRLRLTSGANYYIEASTSFLGLNRPANGIFEAALYNTTTSTEIGQRLVCNLASNGRTDQSPRSTRWCARALILSGDFGANPTMDIEFRVVDCSPLDIWFYSLEATPLEGTSQVTIYRIP